MSKHTEGKWHKSRGTSTAWEVVSDTAPKTRRVVARCGGPDREGNVDLISAAPELLEVVKSFVVETVDYMTLNKLGDAEQQHNVKWARSIIAKAEGRS